MIETRRRRRRRCACLRLAFDLLAITAAWLAAFELRLLLNPLMDIQFARAELARLAPPLGWILVCWTAAGFWLGRYRPGRQPVFRKTRAACESAILITVIAVVIVFFSREPRTWFSRSFILLFAPLNFTALVVSRFPAAGLDRLLRRRWPESERVAVIGDGPELRQFVASVRGRDAAMQLVGAILPQGIEANGVQRPISVLGNSDRLGELINLAHLDRVIVVGDRVPPDEFLRCARIAKRMGVVLSRVVGAAEPDSRFEFSAVSGLHLLDVHPVPFTRRQELFKRIFDVVLAAAALVLCAPVFFAVALAIKLTSPGPVIFTSARVGRGGRHFRFLKFRTMVDGAHLLNVGERNEKGGHIFKIRNDPRVTPVGRFLRRYSLDELPQLINVLRGEMSLVGPRPLPASDLDPDGHSKLFAAWAEQRSRVLPGITGLWQVRGRSDLEFESMIELDTQYIRKWSLWLDLAILLQTPLAVLRARGAY